MNCQSLITVLCVVGLVDILPARAQEFEVASVKPHNGAGRGMMIRPSPGGRFNVENFSLKRLIAAAYKVRDYQISGGPGWIESDRFDIVAKAEGNPPFEQMLPMLQKLLEDRFKLQVRHETKELPVYALLPAKNGIKLKAAEEGTCFKPEPNKPPPPPSPPGSGQKMQVPCGGVFMAPNTIAAGNIPMQQFANVLSQLLGRSVIDKTGFTATFNVNLEWTPDQSTPGLGRGAGDAPPPPPAESGPSIFTALQEQLGLRLESQKGPVEMIVIEHVEKPAEN